MTNDQSIPNVPNPNWALEIRSFIGNWLLGFKNMPYIKKIFFFIFVTITLFGFVPPLLAADSPKGPTLELVYPIIPGQLEEEVMSAGLPQYVKYIFNLAIMLIGIVIFLVLIYNGFLWFTSSGNADKLKTAKEGITAAFLGSLILFSAYIIFKTINPQLTILELKNPDAVEPVIIPGIYLCNYDVDSVHSKNSKLATIQDILLVYTFVNDANMSEKVTSNDITEAVKAFQYYISNPAGKCSRVNGSGNLVNLIFSGNVVMQGTNKTVLKQTIFQIPEKRYELDPKTGEPLTFWDYNYGIIFHEEDFQKGKCHGYVYKQIEPNPKLGFGAHSVTLFKKPSTEPNPASKGVVLYNCLDPRTGTSLCPEGVSYLSYLNLSSATDPKIADYISENGLPYVTGRDDLTGTSEDIKSGKLVSTQNSLEENVRSITIDPENFYFAILFSKDNYDASDFCEVITKSDINLMDNPIGQCGADCNKIINDKNVSATERLKKCTPCTKSAMSIKGEVIK